MSETIETLLRTIEKAETLDSVVRTMKTLAAANIRQYEEAVRSLGDYYHTIELGLGACLRQSGGVDFELKNHKIKPLHTIAVVFGSDQGLVGQFNDQLVDFMRLSLDGLTSSSHFLAVGERIQLSLRDTGLEPVRRFAVPNSVNAITPLVGDILAAVEEWREKVFNVQLYLFYNTPVSGEFYRSLYQRLLPFDEQWEREIKQIAWPTKALPEILSGVGSARWALIREYLFVSIFRACANSLASENASRLSAMQRAEKNIEELLDDLARHYNNQRQAGIDEELFDVVSGFTALRDRR
jgi:F-type H+-transporting ATPase subunit gamma